MVWDAPPEMWAPPATIRPRAIAMSRIASSLTEGSITRPPLRIKSYFAGTAVNAFVFRISTAAPAAAVKNCRLFSISNLLLQHRSNVSLGHLSNGNARDLFHRLSIDGRNRRRRVIRHVNEPAVRRKCHPERIYGDGYRAEVLQVGQRIRVDDVI